ncbi:FAD dependent oxidoreductase [Phaeosphaeriaceae sp. PMI808]|nr:FAD dependent oxidoreductase [Phaeosphaeriaceae sp. PMI808]
MTAISTINRAVPPIPTYFTARLDRPDLQPHANIVIIGPGYVGTSIVHHLIEESARCDRPLPSILILEAREVCSGATGRNGGHFKPDLMFRAASVLKTHGKEVAEHVASFEARQADAVKDLIMRENVDCDFEKTRIRDDCLYEEGWDKIKADPAKLNEVDIPTVREINYISGSEAEKVSGVRGAISCLTYNAARLWPYRLVSHMLEKRSTNANSKYHRWLADTPRGFAKTDIVVYATNGYTSALVPEMNNKIVPVKGIIVRLVGVNAPKLADSYMMRFSDYDKLIESLRHYFDGYMQRHLHSWENSVVHTENIWTGIMGYSNDDFPYVGPACDKPGQYMCAGFTGHGMPQIYFSAKAIASMIITGDTEGVDLPVLYRISRTRWYQSKEHASLKLWQRISGSQPAPTVL